VRSSSLIISCLYVISQLFDLFCTAVNSFPSIHPVLRILYLFDHMLSAQHIPRPLFEPCTHCTLLHTVLGHLLVLLTDCWYCVLHSCTKYTPYQYCCTGQQYNC
jgi:hypothetical protein